MYDHNCDINFDINEKVNNYHELITGVGGWVLRKRKRDILDEENKTKKRKTKRNQTKV